MNDNLRGLCNHCNIQSSSFDTNLQSSALDPEMPCITFEKSQIPHNVSQYRTCFAGGKNPQESASNRDRAWGAGPGPGVDAHIWGWGNRGDGKKPWEEQMQQAIKNYEEGTLHAPSVQQDDDMSMSIEGLRRYQTLERYRLGVCTPMSMKGFEIFCQIFDLKFCCEALLRSFVAK